MSGLRGQLGIALEPTFGTYTVANRFTEFVSEGIKVDTKRIDSKSIGRSRALRADRWVPVITGASGDIQVEAGTAGLTSILPLLSGDAAVGTTVAGLTTFTANIAAVSTAKSATILVDRPFADGGSQCFAFTGCKVSDWEISGGLDDLVGVKLSMDAAGVDLTKTFPASPTFPTMDLLSDQGGLITVGGVSVAVSKWSVACKTGINTGRRFVARGAVKKEQVVDSMVELTYNLDVEFTSMSHMTRYLSATATGALASVSVDVQGPVAVGSVKPSLNITSLSCRSDGDDATIGGSDILTQSLTYTALVPVSGALGTITYVTTDTAF